MVGQSGTDRPASLLVTSAPATITEKFMGHLTRPRLANKLNYFRLPSMPVINLPGPKAAVGSMIAP